MDETVDVLMVDLKIYKKKNKQGYWTLVDNDPTTARWHATYEKALWYLIRVITSYGQGV